MKEYKGIQDKKNPQKREVNDKMGLQSNLTKRSLEPLEFSFVSLTPKTPQNGTHLSMHKVISLEGLLQLTSII